MALPNEAVVQSPTCGARHEEGRHYTPTRTSALGRGASYHRKGYHYYTYYVCKYVV